LNSFKKTYHASSAEKEDSDVQDIDGILRLSFGFSIERSEKWAKWGAYPLKAIDILGGDQVYCLAIALNYADPYQGDLDDEEDLGRGGLVRLKAGALMETYRGYKA
jgi:hypothetical protein